MITIPGEWWTLLLGTVLPAVVALVKSRWSSGRVGALVLLGLTVLTAVASEIIVDATGAATFSWQDVAERFVLLFVVAVAFHFGLLKPTGITGSQGVIAEKVPAGIGAPSPRHAADSRTVFNGGPEGVGPGGGG